MRADSVVTTNLFPVSAGVFCPSCGHSIITRVSREDLEIIRQLRALTGCFLSPSRISGRSPAQPNLLRYALDLKATVRLSGPATVTVERQEGKAQPAAQQQHPLAGILGGRPLLTLAFDDMEMLVGKPVVLGLPQKKSAAMDGVKVAASRGAAASA